MTYILLFVLLVIVVMQFRLASTLKLMIKRLDGVEAMFRVRQGQIGRQKAVTKNPTVDSKARTVVRDTDDLPLTGRMSTGIHRVRSTDARIDYDN